jgi:anti-sigma factor RsiW
VALNCDGVRARLQDYVTRELTPDERRMVDEHLLACAECRQELALMTIVVTNLDHQPVLEPGPDFSARVMARLPARVARTVSPLWSLVAAPVLGLVGFLFRVPFLSFLLGLAGRFGIGAVRLPDPNSINWLQPTFQLGLLVFLVAVFGGALFFGWRYYSEDL